MRKKIVYFNKKLGLLQQNDTLYKYTSGILMLSYLHFLHKSFWGKDFFC